MPWVLLARLKIMQNEKQIQKFLSFEFCLQLEEIPEVLDKSIVVLRTWK